MRERQFKPFYSHPLFLPISFVLSSSASLFVLSSHNSTCPPFNTRFSHEGRLHVVEYVCMLTGRIILRFCVCRYRCSQKHSINLVFCFSRSFPCVAHRVAWRDYGIYCWRVSLLLMGRSAGFDATRRSRGASHRWRSASPRGVSSTPPRRRLWWEATCSPLSG